MGPLAFWLNEEFDNCHYAEDRSIRHILVFIDSAALLVFTSKIALVKKTDTNFKMQSKVMIRAIGYPYMHCFIVQARKLLLQFVLLHLGLIFSPKYMFVPIRSTV